MPSDDRPVIESRCRRLGVYLRHNGVRICRDVGMLATWALAVTIWGQGTALPRWMWYVVTFVGVVGYARATTPWTRPYRSPDDFGSVAADDRLRQEPEQRHE